MPDNYAILLSLIDLLFDAGGGLNFSQLSVCCTFTGYGAGETIYISWQSSNKEFYPKTFNLMAFVFNCNYPTTAVGGGGCVFPGVFGSMYYN